MLWAAQALKAALLEEITGEKNLQDQVPIAAEVKRCILVACMAAENNAD